MFQYATINYDKYFWLINKSQPTASSRGQTCFIVFPIHLGKFGLKFGTSVKLGHVVLLGVPKILQCN